MLSDEFRRYLEEFTAMAHAVRKAVEQIKEDEDRRSAQYQRGYQDGLRAREVPHD